jgi:hypothetical protein
MKSLLLYQTVLTRVYPVVIEGFRERYGRISDDADRPQEVSGCGVKHEWVQQINIANVSMGLAKRLVPCYLGVCDQAVPVFPSLWTLRQIRHSSLCHEWGHSVGMIILYAAISYFM